MKVLNGVICLSLFMYSCSHHEIQSRPPKQFTSFEISYSDGWRESFSFLVDSNQVFLAAPRPDSTKYGLLPDSLFKVIDSAVLQIVNDSSIRLNKEDVCADCAAVAVKLIRGKDTINIHQIGTIDSVFQQVIQRVEAFLRSNKEGYVRTFVFFETRTSVMPPPSVPPLPPPPPPRNQQADDMIKFTPPKVADQ